MKLRSLIFILAVTFIFCNVFQKESRAMTAGAGLSLWYAWWEPYWVDAPDMLGVGSFDIDPGVLFGPVASLKFNEQWSMTTSFTFGSFKSSATGILLGIPGTFITIDRKATRYDFDLILEYRFNETIKLFGGLKYFGYNLKNDMKIIVGGFPVPANSEVNHWNLGPGFGAIFTFPLGNNFYIITNINLIVMFGSLNIEYDNPIAEIIPSNAGSTLMYYLGNAGLSLAYYVESINTTLALGGRFQYLFIDNLDTGSMESGYSDMFFGITFSAMYVFDF